MHKYDALIIQHNFYLFFSFKKKVLVIFYTYLYVCFVLKIQNTFDQRISLAWTHLN